MIDALTVRALGAELNENILRGRVQNIFSLAPQVIGLEIYANHARHYLLASAEPTRARLMLISEKLRRAPTPLSPFLLLFKKYTLAAFVNRIEVVSRERILHIEFDHHEQGISTLVVELMGNRANLILLDAGGVILDALRRVPSSLNRARTLEPHELYLPPPSQDKADPLAVTVAELHSLLSRASGETLAQRLVEAIAGTSPLFARELVYRVTGATDTAFESTLLPKLHAELTRVWRSPAEPCLAWEQDQPIQVAAYALTHLAGARLEMLPTMSAALEKFYGS
ncbi:MAG TPA: NFACT family protein, partial [Anaerolineae bacterium]|nr:NFACT family protein [Anaerolineae bacterium]